MLFNGEQKEIFANVLMHQTGPDFWNPVCRDCLRDVVRQEIESIEYCYYVETDPTRLPIERKVLRSLRD